MLAGCAIRKAVACQPRSSWPRRRPKKQPPLRPASVQRRELRLGQRQIEPRKRPTTPKRSPQLQVGIVQPPVLQDRTMLPCFKLGRTGHQPSRFGSERPKSSHAGFESAIQLPCICELLVKRSSALEGGSADILVRSNVRKPGGARKKTGPGGLIRPVPRRAGCSGLAADRNVRAPFE